MSHFQYYSGSLPLYKGGGAPLDIIAYISFEDAYNLSLL